MKTSKPCAYTVKVVNQKKKSEFTLHKLPLPNSLQSKNLKLRFTVVFNLFHLSLDSLTWPGHGLRGRLRWILDDADLSEMYSEYPKKQDFNHWCYNQVDDAETHKACGHKRATTTDGAALAPKAKLTCVRKVSEVEEIIKDLREKHGTNFNVEQFSMWAHIIHIGKHSSREAPPDLPFFQQGNKKTTVAPSSSASIPTSSSSVAVSSGKRVSLRSECINQLDKWHSLLEKGITQEQYEEMQKAIVKDMHKLF